MAGDWVITTAPLVDDSVGVLLSHRGGYMAGVHCHPDKVDHAMVYLLDQEDLQ